MSKVQHYREALGEVHDMDAFLMKESGLPGPRGNIELGQAVADFGDEALFRRLLLNTPDIAPTNSPREFLAFCGAVGMGKLLAEGHVGSFAVLRPLASDPRWRMREGVAMALQRLGLKDMGKLLDEMEEWSKGSPLEQRAAAAALCEPALLKDKEQAARVLMILDRITTSVFSSGNRKTEEFIALRKGLAYCWSVAVAACPEEGKKAMEKWFSCQDRDIVWVMKENLKKKRLERVDAAWVARWKSHFKI